MSKDQDTLVCYIPHVYIYDKKENTFNPLECSLIRYAILPHILWKNSFWQEIVMRLSSYQWKDSNGSLDINYAHYNYKQSPALISFYPQPPHLLFYYWQEKFSLNGNLFGKTNNYSYNIMTKIDKLANQSLSSLSSQCLSYEILSFSIFCAKKNSSEIILSRTWIEPNKPRKNTELHLKKDLPCLKLWRCQ